MHWQCRWLLLEFVCSVLVGDLPVTCYTKWERRRELKKRKNRCSKRKKQEAAIQSIMCSLIKSTDTSTVVQWAAAFDTPSIQAVPKLELSWMIRPSWARKQSWRYATGVGCHRSRTHKEHNQFADLETHTTDWSVNISGLICHVVWDMWQWRENPASLWKI